MISKFSGYIITGGIAAVVDLGGFRLMIASGFSLVASAILSWLTAAVVNYNLTSRFRGARRAAFRWSCIPPVDVHVVYKQRRGTWSLVDRPSTPEREINKWVHRPRQFRWSRLAPNSSSVEKKSHRLRGQINAESVVTIDQDAIGNIDFLTDPHGFLSVLPNVQVSSIGGCVMTIVFDNVNLNASLRGSYRFQ